MEQVPYTVYESAMARADKRDRRKTVVIVIAIILLFASNLLWLRAWTAYDYTGSEVEIDSQGGGNANYIGANGVISNGEDQGQN